MAEQMNKAFGGLNIGGVNFKPTEIFERLGITYEQFAYLLDRDFFAPVFSHVPDENTLSYIDPVMGACNLRVGQPVVYSENGERKIAFLKGIEKGKAIWENINSKVVSTEASQGLTDTEKSNARANIGAGTSSFSGSYNDLNNKPVLAEATTDTTEYTDYF